MECAKVLVVDQEQRSYEAIKHGLSKHGYEIHTSTNTTKALALAGAHRYKVALLSLPLACDTTLLAGLQHELPDLCIIVTFSSTPCEDSHHIPPQLLRVATNSMGKPFTVERVQLMLDHALELASLRTQVRQQRQAWVSGEILVSPPDDSECGPKPTPMSLEDVLAQKLRPIVPSLEHLGRGSLHRVVLSYVEKLLLTIVLTECRGNQLKSAEILGINRNTLRKKIREFKLSFPRGGS